MAICITEAVYIPNRGQVHVGLDSRPGPSSVPFSTSRLRALARFPRTRPQIGGTRNGKQAGYCIHFPLLNEL